MAEADFFLLFVAPLNKMGVRYMVGGSVAMTFYGEPRFTQDVDIIIFLNDREIPRLGEAFPAADFYVPPIETMFAEFHRERGGQFNIIQAKTGFKADIYPAGRDELNAWAFRFKRTMEYEGEPVILAPPEYVIVSKLEYYREGKSDKHLRDIRSMIAVSGAQMDHAALHDWIQRRGLEAEWRLVRD